MASLPPPLSTSDQRPEYFLLEDGRSSEVAYSLERLRERGINTGDYVWREGMEDWRPAGEVAELRDALDLGEAPGPRSVPMPRPSASDAYGARLEPSSGYNGLGQASDAPLEAHRDLVIVGTIAVWLAAQVMSTLSTLFVIQSWPSEAVGILSRLLWTATAATPIALAFLVRRRGSRTAALVGGVLLLVLSVGGIVYWEFLY